MEPTADAQPGHRRPAVHARRGVRPHHRLQTPKDQDSPDYLPQLERDILEVIRKYVDISPEQIAVSLEKRDDELSVLELNVTFPEDKR